MEILLICRPYTYEHSTKTISPKYEVTAAKSMFDSLLCLIRYVIGHSNVNENIYSRVNFCLVLLNIGLYSTKIARQEYFFVTGFTTAESSRHFGLQL